MHICYEISCFSGRIIPSKKHKLSQLLSIAVDLASHRQPNLVIFATQPLRGCRNEKDKSDALTDYPSLVPSSSLDDFQLRGPFRAIKRPEDEKQARERILGNEEFPVSPRKDIVHGAIEIASAVNGAFVEMYTSVVNIVRPATDNVVAKWWVYIP